MPDLFELEANDWTLIVWSRDITKSRQRLVKTLDKREKVIPRTVLQFSPSLFIRSEDRIVPDYEVSQLPIFFENKLYEFEFQFVKGHVKHGTVKLSHRLREIEDAFRFSPRTDSLRGSIDFKNHVGRCQFTLSYHNNTQQITQSISFDVLPTKMDLENDLKEIQQTIEAEYPSWLFSLAEKTQQSFGYSTERRKSFPVLWLAHFTRLRDELNQGVQQILHSPHSRLLEHKRYKRAERLKGRLPQRLEQSVNKDIGNGLTHKRYAVYSAKLSVDTPENRFVKNVLNICIRTLAGFIGRLESNNSNELTRLSDSFITELQAWKSPLEKQRNQPFFGEIGQFESLTSESLVLHQKAGYSTVYRVWQQLRLYLSVLGRQTDVSVKPISELYEVWCFLEIRKILCDDLGFVEKKSEKRQRNTRDGVFGLNADIASSFVLVRGNVTIRLMHERQFNNKGKSPKSGETYSWTTAQKPDILLEAEIDGGHLIYWIFDAKYRIQEGSGDQDFAPDDAINQMHRYRDALIHLHKDESRQSKTRPVFGAFALYPGWFESVGHNPYEEAINETAIGAFPLLPGQSNQWLRDFLATQLGEEKSGKGRYITDNPDYFYVQEAIRIPYNGMKSSHYDDLVFVTTIGGSRSAEYKKGFQNGEARWYHLPLETSDRNVARRVMKEIRQCSFAVHEEGSSNRLVRYLYNIKSVRLVIRNQISVEQSGAKAKAGSDDREYWLFELGNSYQVSSPVELGGVIPFQFRLVKLSDIETAEKWNDLPNLYGFL